MPWLHTRCLTCLGHRCVHTRPARGSGAAADRVANSRMSLSPLLQELITELQDQESFGKRGEGWAFAELAALFLLLIPPFTLTVSTSQGLAQHTTNAHSCFHPRIVHPVAAPALTWLKSGQQRVQPSFKGMRQAPGVVLLNRVDTAAVGAP